MAKKKDRTPLQRTNYVSTFQITGRPVITDNTFQLDQKSQKSDWIYNRMSLLVDCGEKCGNVFVSSLGGFGSERQNVLYVHGKKQDGSSDFANQFTIDWADRLDPAVVSEIGPMALKTVGLQKDVKGKTVYKNFISDYDVIEYVSENLTNDMIVNIKGNLKYQFYNGSVNVQLEMTSIALSNANESDLHASFTQTVLLDENSKGEIDKATGEIDITGYALEYAKEYHGHDITDKKTKKGEQVPMPFNFKYKVNLENKELAQKAVKKLFGVKSGYVNQVTFNGEIVSSGATVELGVDDLPDDIKELIAIGVYTEEEALATCATNGNRERKMILLTPRIRNVAQDNGAMSHEVQIFEEFCDQSDLDYFLNMAAEEIEEMEDDAMNAPVDEPEEVEFESVTEDDSDLGWLNDL